MVVDEVQSHATTIVIDDDVTVLSTIVMFLLFIHNHIFASTANINVLLVITYYTYWAYIIITILYYIHI